MKKTFQFSIWFFLVFTLLSLFCNMPQDPFKKPSNSKVRLFLKENEQTISFGSEIEIGVSVFLAEHLEELHIFTMNNELDSTHIYNSNAVDDTLYFNWTFLKEGIDTIFLTGKLKDKSYKDKADTLPIFVLPAPDSIRFDSIPQSLFTVTEKFDTLLFIASLRSEKPLSFSVKSDPDLDTNHLEVMQSNDTARVIVSTDEAGKYGIKLYAKRDTLKDSAKVDLISYEPLVFKTVVVPDTITLGSSDSLVFILPTEREDTITCKLINEEEFSESEISVLTESADSLVIIFTPENAGKRDLFLLLDNGKISDTLKYSVTVVDNPSVGLYIENHKDTVPFGTPVNIGISVFLPQLIEELHIHTSDKSLDSALELSATDNTVYVSHEFGTEGEVKIYVTAKPVNSAYEEKTDSLIVNVLPPIDTTEFQVTYDGNGFDSGKVPVTTTGYKPASNVIISADTGNFSKKGYAFYSWNTEKDGSGIGIAPGDTFVISEDVTFYAQWIIKQYNLTFDNNGSTSGEAPEQKKYDYKSKITIPCNGNLEREGYRFLSWNTKQDGSGISYTEGDTFSMPDSDIELFAQWEALLLYKVTYNANDADSGKVPVDSNSYYEGKEVTVAGNPGNLHKNGYSYSGWNTEANGKGETFNAGAKFAMPDSAVTLYVKWTTKPTYSISYHGNTNTDGKVPQTVDADSGTEVTIADSGSLYKTGYTFVEWNTKEDGSGKSYKTGDKIIMDTVDINLYAQWTKARYSVIYHGNGNTGGTIPPKTTHLYLSEITVADSVSISKTGHSFYCWNTDSAGNGIDYSGGNKITIENDIHLFARWIKNKYRITFIGNGDRAQNVPDITEYEYGLKIDSVAVVPSRQSYTFDGWFRDSLCTDKWKYDSDSVISHDTLYARWIIKDIDGNIYTEVKIGDQVWMVENLKVTRYNDGTIIPKITTSAAWTNLYSCEQNPCIYKSGYCWYNNDSTTYHIYGTLYSWAVVGTNKLAPTGWHVPSQLEFEKLVQLIKNDESVNVVGGKLKETGTSHWDEPNEGATDSVGFKALPGGFRNHDGEGTFGGIGKIGCWWLSTDVTMGASMCFRITYDRINLENNYSSKSAGYNVRCIRDW